MKNLRTTAVCVSILLHSLYTSAQIVAIPINEPDYNKPKLFSNLPDKIPVSLNDLSSLFTAQVGSDVSLTLSTESNLSFAGDVVSTVNKYSNSIQSIVVRSSNFNGASFTVSKIIASDGKVSYTGRIISFQHGDLYELQTKNNELVLVKRKLTDLVNE